MLEGAEMGEESESMAEMAEEFESRNEMAKEMESAEAEVVLKCQNSECGIENSADSIFCRHCGSWLVRQWQAVIMKGRAPIDLTLKLGPRGPETVVTRRFATKTDINVTVRVTEGGRRDVIAYVEDPNGNVVAGDRWDRIQDRASLQCQSYVPGDYRLVLNNSFSRFASKAVELTLAGF